MPFSSSASFLSEFALDFGFSEPLRSFESRTMKIYQECGSTAIFMSILAGVVAILIGHRSAEETCINFSPFQSSS